MTGATEPITREQVVTLITRYRPHQAQAPAEATVSAWLTSLAGCSYLECEAALLALGPSAARSVTPSEIAGRVEAARDRASAASSPQAAARRDRAAERAHFVAVGARGIRAVYEAMGWHRDPEHDRARQVRCPFCRAAPGVLCSPLSRRRDGRQEFRDPKTRMHPSRHKAARRTTAHSGANQ
ncbi:zinc finger domain-containing protein [Amycolatopsis anabasis]|uniref:zinc finger domain-containing protein n=1 Tax=Amycolatopsis anabasis TaxID=1840409 RepID=UPI00131E4603|nr:hypothetical protein [Amycolatopsis anabasis]